MMGLGKPQLHAKFEGAGFIYYRNIREFVLKNWDKLKWVTPYFWKKRFYHCIRSPNVSYLMYNFC